MLQIKNLTKIYDGGVKALEKAELEVFGGRIHAILLVPRRAGLP